MTTETIRATPQKLDFRASLRKHWPQIKDFFIHAIGQVRIWSKAYPGIMHFLIFWGVTVQVLGTAINLMQMQLFIPFVELPFPREMIYLVFELVMDLAGVSILLGVTLAAIRRAFLKPKTLDTQWDDIYSLALLALIPIIGFTVEGLRLVSMAPPWSPWSPVGNLVANIFRALGLTPEQATGIHNAIFWTHVVLALALVASIPFTKLRHLVVTPLNVIFHPRRKGSTYEKIENIEETEMLGVSKITEFTTQQLLSFDACVRCGRCEEACPVAICGMPYTPKSFIQTLRNTMVSDLVSPNGNTNHDLLGAVIPEKMPWSCTTCGACLSRCPAFVNPVDEIIDLRRFQTLTTGKISKSVGDALRNMERQGNPWGIPAEDRLAWAEGLEIRELLPGEETDVLLFLGCAFAFDDRNKKVARSFARLLQKAGVDFAILGLDEICCGETARRLGHEYLFQVLTQQNIEVFSQVKFNRIVTQCPHCFNTLKNEYPQMGGNHNVQHYTEYLVELSIPWDSLSSSGKDLLGNLTFHDSCYLGRYNQIYQQPRKLLSDTKVSIIEMANREQNSFCCGGGGGQMWLETDAETRINHHRLQEALEVNADTIATACPYCLLMFDDAIRSKGVGESVQVMDIAEILDRQLQNIASSTGNSLIFH